MKHLFLLSATALAVTSGLMFGTMQTASALCTAGTVVCNDTLFPPNDPQLSPTTVPEPSSIFSLLALGTLSASFVLKRNTNSL
ncbi:MAG TPA: PEP-CTERM sorting domain-containing protein [Nodularia sp. (in: cyanobacteria)]|nr:PEP-CTERM sorting domain-containing protein [Nodularia sp. (in: cyanobacteria)]